MKIDRNIILIVIIFVTQLFGQENWNAINKIIQGEKGYLLDANKGCLKCYFYHPDSTIRTYFENNREIKTIPNLKSFLASLKYLGCCKSKYCNRILDEKIFVILIGILDNTNDKMIVKEIYEYIYNKRNILFLKKYSNAITKITEKKEYGELSLTILLMCENVDKKKEQVKDRMKIFYGDNFPIYTRIRLGEIQVEDTLIQMYRKETNFENLKKLIEQIELAGTAKCEMALVNSLGKKNVVQYSDMYSYSIAFYIIQALGELNPESNILNDDFLDFKKEIEKDGFNVDLNVKHTKKYLENVYNFILLRYGVKIEELKNIDFIYSFKVNETPAGDAQLYELQRQLNGK
jgi:hypothetical protein